MATSAPFYEFLRPDCAGLLSTGTNQVLRYNGATGAFIDIFVSSGSGGVSAPTFMAFYSTPTIIGSTPITFTATVQRVPGYNLSGDNPIVVDGLSFSQNLTIKNVGSTAAYNVELTDISYGSAGMAWHGIQFEPITNVPIPVTTQHPQLIPGIPDGYLPAGNASIVDLVYFVLNGRATPAPGGTYPLHLKLSYNLYPPDPVTGFYNPLGARSFDVAFRSVAAP